MTYDEVIAELTARGAVSGTLALLPRRFEPVGQADPEGTFLLPVETQDGRYLAACFSFGRSDPDPALDWEPVWRSVEGPMTREQLEDLGRSLKAPQG